MATRGINRVTRIKGGRRPPITSGLSARAAREERKRLFRERVLGRTGRIMQERDLRRRVGVVPVGRDLVEKLRAFARGNPEATMLIERFERLVFVVDDKPKAPPAPPPEHTPPVKPPWSPFGDR